MGNATFEANEAQLFGGALYFDEGSTLEIDGPVLFRRNSAWTAGAVSMSTGLGYMVGTRFDSNVALITGGAIVMFGSGSDRTPFEFERCEFVANRAEGGSGGAVLFGGGFINVASCDFVRNRAGECFSEGSELRF